MVVTRESSSRHKLIIPQLSLPPPRTMSAVPFASYNENLPR